MQNSELESNSVRPMLCEELQRAVGTSLIRHRSVLDTLSKLNEASARVNRAVLKSATSCGCVDIVARKPRIPANISLAELRDFMPTHVEGAFCPNCQDVIEDEMGGLLFYIAALCNASELSLHHVMEKEQRKLHTLGMFHGS